MKKNVFRKAILSLILALVVIFSCVCPAFAANDDEWVLNGDTLYITHNGNPYMGIYDIKTSDYNPHGYEFETDDYTEIELKFDSPATASSYRGAYVNVYKSTDNFVEAYIPSRGYVLFVSTDYMSKFGMLQYGYADDYKIKNQYGIETSLSQDNYSNIITKITTSTISNTYYEWLDLYAVDKNNDFSCLSGAVLRSRSSGELYMLRYNDYDTSFFYANGQFARLDSGRTYTLYQINDETVADYINKLIDARPEDELDWLAGTEPGKVAKVIAAIFFFGLLPLAIIVLCVIALIKSKKKFYRVPLITLIVGALALMISAAVLCF